MTAVNKTKVYKQVASTKSGTCHPMMIGTGNMLVIVWVESLVAKTASQASGRIRFRKQVVLVTAVIYR